MLWSVLVWVVWGVGEGGGLVFVNTLSLLLLLDPS